MGPVIAEDLGDSAYPLLSRIHKIRIKLRIMSWKAGIAWAVNAQNID